jgi:hypothetical protein
MRHGIKKETNEKKSLKFLAKLSDNNKKLILAN